ncbi:MAG TPA: hypothetical protein VFX77_09580 [Rubrobacter sp.]|nr:hypothetical protein [Rubrobacter sp.]
MNSSTTSLVEEIMFVRVCGGLCGLLGSATPPKWERFLEPLSVLKKSALGW